MSIISPGLTIANFWPFLNAKASDELRKLFMFG